MKTLSLSVVLLVFSLILAGCYYDTYRRPNVQPRAAVVHAPTPIPKAPPARKRERIPPPPSHHHVWIPGAWKWKNQAYFWEAGRYAVPPRGKKSWVPGRYEHKGARWVHRPGRWR